MIKSSFAGVSPKKTPDFENRAVVIVDFSGSLKTNTSVIARQDEVLSWQSS